MFAPTTIYSDDEVEPEVDIDMNNDEGGRDTIVINKKPTGKHTSSTGSKTAPKTSKKEFAFEFDDGESLEFAGTKNGRKKSNSSSNEQDDSENDSENDSDYDDQDIDDQGEIDNVRMMPRTIERSQRAVEKLSSKLSKIEKTKKSRGDEPQLEGMDVEAEKSFFDEVIDSKPDQSNSLTFAQLNLSRPLLRAIEASGYLAPTPVQARVIPLAMAGRDICASAVTGSGKTAAFVLPVLERLLYRPRDTAAIRMLVVTPTRELATQIFAVLQKLAQFTDVTCALICGGKKDLKSQEATLRQRPDIVVCTPGRFIDHLRNSQSVSIEDLDVLVLDEVDRLLELGFQEEVEELLRFCPVGESRQTLLFSATMTPRVEDLAKLSLRKPIRIKTSAGVSTVAPRLIQEFVKVRKDDEHQKEAMMAALICRSFSKRTIAFFETKKDAHRFYVLLSLLGISCCELHGDMTQTHRYLALDSFRSQKTEVMVCTDVAARGLDIPGVMTVLNAEMPRSVSTYVHRVGRTARAGCGGRAVTLVTDARRKVMKDVLKQKDTAATGSGAGSDGAAGSLTSDDLNLLTSMAASMQVLSRTVPAAVVAHYADRIVAMEDEIQEFYRQEKINRHLDLAEGEAERAQNLLMFEDEIKSRPARTWHQTETQKRELKETILVKVKARDEELKQAGLGAKRSAEQLADELAKRDDYRVEDKENTKERDKAHRLSRKKRRRQEAIDAGKESMSEDREGGDDGDDDRREYSEEISLKKSAKHSKTAKRENEEKFKDLVLGEIGAKNSKIKTESGKTKILRPKFAVGGLDQDLMEWGMGSGKTSMKGKDQKRMDRQIEEFRGFDPDKRLRKQGKIAHHGFKSKSKFKRR